MVHRVDFLMRGWDDAAVDEFVQRATRGRGGEADTRDIVTSIIADVRARGGEAVADYTKKFDRFEISPKTLTSDKADLEKIAAKCPSDVKDAVDFAHDRIARYHEAQQPEDHSFEDGHGLTLGWKWTSLESVGVYVPGGRANYPSSVLMNMIPAKVAGVERIVMVAPTPDGEMSPAVAYAALKAGVQEYYPIGGAQAVAALAYGAGALKPVDKIVGPGNAFVAEAKRQVFGHVGIDTIAGPSEVCIISDGSLPSDWIIADLLAQAEHDPSAQSILISIGEDDPTWHDIYGELSGGSLIREAHPSIRDYGFMIRVPDLETACKLANRIAPEHLELAIREPEKALPMVRHAGAVFVGGWTPEALGDYVTGSNHVLPTSGAARFSSGLGLLDFMKRISIQQASREGFHHLADAAVALAKSEHLPGHERSVSIRIGKETKT